MKQNTLLVPPFRKLAFVLALSLGFLAQSEARADEECTTGDCTEQSINAPVRGSFETFARPNVDARANYRMPTFDSSWGLNRGLFEKMNSYYEANRGSLSNSRYVAIADFNQRSSAKRLYLFDLASGSVERHLVAHGAGSDPDHDGYATLFSDTNDSHMSSIGFYQTDATYIGKHGYSLRLRGLSSTNAHAYQRAVVMHPANYVSEASSRAGNSWGCAAMDPKFATGIINKMRGGALLLIDR